MLETTMNLQVNETIFVKCLSLSISVCNCKYVPLLNGYKNVIAIPKILSLVRKSHYMSDKINHKFETVDNG